MIDKSKMKEAYEAGRAEAIHIDRFCGRQLVMPWQPLAQQYFARGFLLYGGTQEELDNAFVGLTE